MTIQVSTGLRNSMLDTESLVDSLNDGLLEIYDGTPPLDPDDATAGNLLVTFTDNDQAIAVGNGLDFEAVAVAGIIEKLSGQLWQGTPVLTGTATYYRLVEYADRNGTGGGSSTTAKRVQGVVGTVLPADLIVTSTGYTLGVPRSIDAYQLAFPA